MTQVPPQVHPFWELERPTICHSLGESLSKKSDPLYLATLAKERIKEQLGNHLQIFTDGSVLESGEVGCAFVIPDLKIRRYTLPTSTSIFTAELCAILMACSTVNDLPSLPPPSSEYRYYQTPSRHYGPLQGETPKTVANCKLRSSSLPIS